MGGVTPKGTLKHRQHRGEMGAPSNNKFRFRCLRGPFLVAGRDFLGRSGWIEISFSTVNEVKIVGFFGLRVF